MQMSTIKQYACTVHRIYPIAGNLGGGGGGGGEFSAISSSFAILIQF